MVMSNGDDMAPKLKLLWGVQARLLPQQGLFVKAIAMLLGEAQSIAHGNLSDVGLLVPDPAPNNAT